MLLLWTVTVALRSRVHENLAIGKPESPREEGTFGIIFFEVFPKLNQGGLDDVIGVRMVRHHRKDITIQGPFVLDELVGELSSGIF